MHLLTWGLDPLTWGLVATGGPPPPPPPPPLDLEQAVLAALLADADLTTLLATRIYPVRIPETAALPALAYRIIGATRAMYIRGAAGMCSISIRFEAMSFSHADVKAIREILRQRLQGLIGLVSGLKICFVTLEDEEDDYYEAIEGSDIGTHYKRFDLRFKLRESIPTLT